MRVLLGFWMVVQHFIWKWTRWMWAVINRDSDVEDSEHHPYSAMLQQLLWIIDREPEDHTRDQLAVIRIVRYILADLERYITSPSRTTIDQIAFRGSNTARLPSEETQSSNLLRQRIFRAVILTLSPAIPFKSVYRIAIHGPNGGKRIQPAELDSGSSHDLISRDLVSSIGYQVEAYKGDTPRGFGPPFRPTDQVTIEWHISKSKSRTKHKTTFAVVDDCPGNWDILLSKSTIRNAEFFIEDPKLWWI
ncbi:MAG: hypothetical protein Q9225_004880 [Loekoesia sp. 1 TL-2023]